MDLLVIDSRLPYPELPQLLSQIQADVNVSRLPLFVQLPAEARRPWCAATWSGGCGRQPTTPRTSAS